MVTASLLGFGFRGACKSSVGGAAFRERRAAYFNSGEMAGSARFLASLTPADPDFPG